MSQPLVLQIDCERRLIDMMMYEYVECCSVPVVRLVRLVGPLVRVGQLGCFNSSCTCICSMGFKSGYFYGQSVTLMFCF